MRFLTKIVALSVLLSFISVAVLAGDDGAGKTGNNNQSEEWLKSKAVQDYLTTNGIAQLPEESSRTVICCLPEKYVGAVFSQCTLRIKDVEGNNAVYDFARTDGASVRFASLLHPSTNDAFASLLRHAMAEPPVAGRIIGTAENGLLVGNFSYREGYGLTFFINNVELFLAVQGENIPWEKVDEALLDQLGPVLVALNGEARTIKTDDAKLALSITKSENGDFKITLTLDDATRSASIVKVTTTAGHLEIADGYVRLYDVPESGATIQGIAISPDGSTCYGSTLKSSDTRKDGIETSLQASDSQAPGDSAHPSGGKTHVSTGFPWYLVIIGAVVIAVGLGLLFLTKRKKH